ncbi:MAG: rRNA maturation RNase YbeY [Nitrospiria bacterium]
MRISILNRQRKYPVDQAQVHHWVRQVLLLQKMENGEVTVVFVNNRRIRVYNRDYRQIDRPTDVLSFPMREGIGGDLHPAFLGDVMISLEMAESDALRYGRDRSGQLLILLIHGILHLLGYDHERSEAEERKMTRRERFILKRIGSPSV